MELVYLWVEDYKNIKKQGFNFSPKFNCKYDPDSNELTIDENDDYIENFFGDNINVTAIVGKNGSGKSNLLELINEDSYEEPTKSPYPISLLDLKKVEVYCDMESDKLYIYTKNINTNVNNESLIAHEEIEEDKYTHAVFIKPTPSHSQEEYILLLNFFKNNNIHFPFKIPKLLNIDIHDDYYDLLEKIKNEDFDFYNKYAAFEEDANKRMKIFHILLLLAYLNNYQISFDVVAHENYDETILDLEYYIKDHMKEKIKSFIELLKNNLKSFSQNPSHYIDINNLDNNFFKTYIEIIKRKNNDEYLAFKGKNIFNFNLFPNMSDGEYQLTYLFNNMYSQIDKENILLIDEGENYLHPNWQKQYVSYLIKFIKDNYPHKKIHLIVTTHSPFLLSDIPKQNIIFLDKDEKGNCKVVDGLKEKKQTFGANIHTLLSDSFFMEDGLMGEFAKGKIDKAITLLNQEKLNEKELKYCEQIISIIGEPIVKNQLQRMLTAKKIDYLAKDTKEEIAFLKHRIDLLSKRL